MGNLDGFDRLKKLSFTAFLISCLMINRG